MTTETKGKKVLVVEDDEVLLAALSSKLEESGLAVIPAKNGVIGFDLARTEHPDIILLDILMPLMDGWEMLDLVRAKDEWGKQVPVVILTNLSGEEEEQIRKMNELGPAYFMVKADWKIENIVDKIIEILNAPQF